MEKDLVSHTIFVFAPTSLRMSDSESYGSATFRISQYAPANETLAMVVAERLDLNGYVLGATAYG